jgi:hypothetical protein
MFRIYNQSYAAFLETLDAQGRSMLRFLHVRFSPQYQSHTDVQPPDASLTPPLALRDACQILREIIQVYDSSLVDQADRSDSATFSQLLGKAVDPSVEMCERMADLRKGATNWDKDIFLINCLGYLQTTLTSVPFTAERVEDLEKKIQLHVESMTYEHVSRSLLQMRVWLMTAR